MGHYYDCPKCGHERCICPPILEAAPVKSPPAKEVKEGLRELDKVVKAKEEGATKHDADKLRYDLIPVESLEEIAKVYTIGAEKYGDDNWRKGMKFRRMAGAILRHFFAFMRGEDRDPEDGQHHLASVAFYLLAMLYFQARDRDDLDDRTGER